MKKAILLGDYGLAKYHPLTESGPLMAQWLAADFAVEVTDEYSGLTLAALSQYDVCVNYIDCWAQKGSDRLAAALLAYVAEGGGLLTVHNGMIAGNSYELEQLYGGRFLMHPPYTRLQYTPSPLHPLAAGMAPFILEEEPYQFEANPFLEAEVFLTYAYGAQTVNAGWTRSFARGRVVCFSPGHNPVTFRQEPVGELLLRCCRWACASPGKEEAT